MAGFRVCRLARAQVDLVGEATLLELEAAIRGINAAAALVRTQRCRLDLARVLGCGAFGAARASEAAAAASAAGPAAEGAERASPPGRAPASGVHGERCHEQAGGADRQDAASAPPAGAEASASGSGRDAHGSGTEGSGGCTGSSHGLEEAGGAHSSAAAGSSGTANGRAGRHRHDSGFATVSVRVSGGICLSKRAPVPTTARAGAEPCRTAIHAGRPGHA
jgi:hypothetical protein